MKRITHLSISSKMVAETGINHGIDALRGIISGLNASAGTQNKIEDILLNSLIAKVGIPESEAKEIKDTFSSYEQMKYNQNVLIEVIAELLLIIKKNK